jgi:hypothetical protein
VARAKANLRNVRLAVAPVSARWRSVQFGRPRQGTRPFGNDHGVPVGRLCVDALRGSLAVARGACIGAYWICRLPPWCFCFGMSLGLQAVRSVWRRLDRRDRFPRE